MKKAVDMLKQRNPKMIVDGEMQAHLPFNLDLMKENHPFSDWAEQGANVLIFPNLSSSNIAYNLVKEIADIEKIGPILLGLKKPVHWPSKTPRRWPASPSPSWCAPVRPWSTVASRPMST